MTDDATPAPLQEQEPTAPSRGRRTLRRVLLGLGWALGALVALAVVLYLFGGMWVRSPEMRAAHEQLVRQGQAEPLEPRLVVPIPGCVCHSDDPVVQAEHSARRIRECMECH